MSPTRTPRRLAGTGLIALVSIAVVLVVSQIASAAQLCYFGTYGSCSSYVLLPSGDTALGQHTVNTTGGLMNNQNAGTSKRFRVCENNQSGCVHRAGWWNSSSLNFSITWSLRDWRRQQCNNMEQSSVAVVCGYIY